jgi:hypothetical protein
VFGTDAEKEITAIPMKDVKINSRIRTCPLILKKGFSKN